MGKKLLGPGVVAAISNIEGGLATAVALSDTSNVRPCEGDGVDARGERVTVIGVGGRESERSYYRPKDKRKNKRAYSKTVWAES